MGERNTSGRHTFSPEQISLRDAWWDTLHAVQIWYHDSLTPVKTSYGQSGGVFCLGRPEDPSLAPQALEKPKDQASSSASQLDPSQNILTPQSWKVGSVFPLQDRFKRSDLDIVNRFCVGKQWNQDKVLDLVARTSRWRKEENIDGIGKDDFPPALTDNLLGFCGKDRRGQPIYYDRPNTEQLLKSTSQCSRHQCLRWHIATAECIKGLQYEAGVDRFTGVIDLAELGMSALNRSMLSTFRDNAIIDQRFYPENLDRMYLVNPPTTFKILWTAARVLLDENTRNKVHVCSTREEANEALGITYDQVPVEFGGTVENGLITVPEVLHSFEENPIAGKPYGFGKHKKLLPCDHLSDQHKGISRGNQEEVNSGVMSLASAVENATAVLSDCVPAVPEAVQEKLPSFLRGYFATAKQE